MAMRSISSADGKTWSAPDGAGNPLFQGPTLTEFRGELWGAWICTQEGYENIPYLYKYVDGKMPVWNGNFGLPEKWRVIGRLSTTTLDDKYYMAYRGASSGKYYVASSPSPKFSDTWKLSPTGGVTELWAYSPTVCAFQGSLIVLGVDAGNQIHFQVMSASGTIERAWTKIENQKTVKAPALCVYQNALYLLHTAENGQECWYGKLTDKTGSWGSFSALASSNISASVSMAVHSDNKLYTTWVNAEGRMYYFTFDGTSWLNMAINTSLNAEGSCGIGSFGGKLYVTLGQKSTTSTASTKYVDGEGVPIRGNTDSDDEMDDIYYEKQEAMQAHKPRWLTPHGTRLLSTSAVEEAPKKRWLPRFFCL